MTLIPRTFCIQVIKPFLAMVLLPDTAEVWRTLCPTCPGVNDGGKDCDSPCPITAPWGAALPLGPALGSGGVCNDGDRQVHQSCITRAGGTCCLTPSPCPLSSWVASPCFCASLTHQLCGCPSLIETFTSGCAIPPMDHSFPHGLHFQFVAPSQLGHWVVLIKAGGGPSPAGQNP